MHLTAPDDRNIETAINTRLTIDPKDAGLHLAHQVLVPNA
jgi:hypothetical protein